MKASDIMTRDVVTIRSSATVAEAMHLMNERGWRSLIVDRKDDADAYGIITETDIASKVTVVGKDPHQVHVYEVMTKPCIVVNPDLRVEYVAKLFIDNRLLRAPVIQGQLLGIISISDVLVKSNLGKQLHKVLPSQTLQERVQHARAVYAAEGPHSENSIAAWNSVEEELSTLTPHHTEDVLKTALEEYFKEIEVLEDPKYLDNFCSG